MRKPKSYLGHVRVNTNVWRQHIASTVPSNGTVQNGAGEGVDRFKSNLFVVYDGMVRVRHVCVVDHFFEVTLSNAVQLAAGCCRYCTHGTVVRMCHWNMGYLEVATRRCTAVYANKWGISTTVVIGYFFCWDCKSNHIPRHIKGRATL